MVLDALQGYAQLASGLTKATRDKAVATAKVLLSQAGLGDVAADAETKVNKLADELIATSKANRKLLGHFVAAEVDKAVQRLGLAKMSDLEELRADLTALVAASAAGVTPSPATPPPPSPAAAAKRPAKKAPAAKKAAAKKAPAKKAVATSPAVAPSPSPTAAANPMSPAKKAAKRAAAKKAPARPPTTKQAAAEATAGTTDRPEPTAAEFG